MKVITQLIRHFWERGALTSLEVEYLLRHNFVRRSDLPGYRPARKASTEAIGVANDTPVEPPDTLELIEDDLVRRKPARRPGRPERDRQLRAQELCDRLGQEFNRRERDLASVLALGQRFSKVDHWWQAASELRSLSQETFYQGLCAELREGEVLLGDVWQASDPEPFHLLIDDEEARGRAARSFLALLVATGPDTLGKYSWILKYDEMKSVINLRVFHSRLLESLCDLYHQDRLLLTHALDRNSDPGQLWALVLLYNAHRDAGLGEAPQYGTEYGPVPTPDYETWEHAWTAALQMDRTTVTRFLVSCYQSGDETEVRMEQEIGVGSASLRPMMCPVGWHLP